MPVATMADTSLDALRFVLVQPRYGGNVGAAARVLKNFGFGRLDVVDPREGADHEEAIRMAVDAGDVLAAARTHATLDDALSGASTVIGTSSRAWPCAARLRWSSAARTTACPTPTSTAAPTWPTCRPPRRTPR